VGVIWLPADVARAAPVPTDAALLALAARCIDEGLSAADDAGSTDGVTACTLPSSLSRSLSTLPPLTVLAVEARPLPPAPLEPGGDAPDDVVLAVLAALSVRRPMRPRR
jgi:hypothetical protein